jgi:hypothetical protein
MPKNPAKEKPLPEAVADTKAGVLRVAGMPDRVWVSCGLTVNLGDYESARMDAGLSSDLRSGESAKDAYERCWKAAEDEVKRQANAVRRDRAQKH